MPERTPSEILIDAMDAQGMVDNDLRAGTAAICGGEGGLKPVPEIGYAHTSNDRIRSIFSAATHLSDERLNQLKANDADFFEAMYGVGTEAGKQIGNTHPGDGYKYRGRGQLQLTGFANYQRYGKLSGHPELVDEPALANDPVIGASIAVAYMLDRYHGGGFEAMKRAVGNSVGGPDATKNALFAKYTESGQWNYHGGHTPASRPTLRRGDDGHDVELMQRELIATGFDCGPAGVDGDFGTGTLTALVRFQTNHGLPPTGTCDAATWAALGALTTNPHSEGIPVQT
jgi:putative chitinase